MLDLASDTPDDWVQRALADLDTVLLDHAHCEKKAASTAINLIFRYQDHPGLMQPLSALAREELEHFEQVIERITARGGRFGPLTPSTYAARLHVHVRKPEPARLLDTLLVCSLIEARSCERMKRLSLAIPDPDLAAFYKGLLASEARHFHGYVEMACAAFPRDDVRSRLHELADLEAEVLREPAGPIRMHSS
jgi:tRNA 2-(methylsulfanyl)-N6-isopentenyladenosine37 hydroxylase